MLDDFEYNGYWWLPESPENKVPGILKFSQKNGALLELFGSFENINDINKMFSNIEIIYGGSIRPEEKVITLHKCFEKSKKVTFLYPDIPFVSNYIVNYVFIGHHFDFEKEVFFKTIRIEIPYLEEWMNISGFDISFNHREKGCTVNYKLPDQLKEIIINNDYLIQFMTSASLPPLNHVQKEATIKQKSYIRLHQIIGEKDIEVWQGIIFFLQVFFSMATGKLIAPSAIKGMTEDCGNEIEIFYQLRYISKKEKVSYYDLSFGYHDIANIFNDVIKYWLENSERLEPVLSLYFSTQSNKGREIDERFLKLARGIESYHRFSHPYNKALSDADHDLRMSKILESVESDDHKKWLKEELRYSNKLTLRQRLHDLFGIYKEVLGHFIDKKDFIDKVCDTRNYLTHFDESLKEKALHGKELYYLNELLIIFLITCLLGELGLETDLIRSIAEKNSFSKDKKAVKALINGHKNRKENKKPEGKTVSEVFSDLGA